jgi:hypothetical protein
MAFSDAVKYVLGRNLNTREATAKAVEEIKSFSKFHEKTFKLALFGPI